MLKAKYKAHKLINIMFYIIVFLIGFYMGSIGKKIGFEEIFNKFLMIDNVSAYNLVDVGDSVIDEKTLLQRVGNIYNDFDFSISKNVFCSNTIPSNNIRASLDCLFFSDDYLSRITFVNYYTGFYTFNLDNDLFYFNSLNFEYHYYYNKNTGEFIDESVGSNGYATSFIGDNNSSSNFNFYLNGNITEEQLSSLNRNINKLSFNFNDSLTFNENLFANNSNFKQVCVDPHKQFIVSSTQLFNGYNYFGDYIWFPYFIEGIYEGEFNLEDNLVTYWNKSSWFLNSKGNIDTYFFPNVGFYPWVFGNLELLDENYVLNQQSTLYPYSSRYSYFGWNALPITMQFNYQGYTSVTSFKFAEDYIQTLSYKDNGLLPFTYNNFDLSDSSNDNLELCFYINKIYDVSYLDKNGSFITGKIETPNGDIDISSFEKDIGFESSDYQALFNLIGEYDVDFGLSTIVLAPLNAIYSISQGICTPQTIDILGKTITLPCGNTIFWNREDIEPFKVFWNMFWGGIICYNIGISIFKLVHDYKHPTNDRVEVIDL